MFLVAQLGARMHYAVPRILSAAGMLERFCTDLVAVRGWPHLLSKIKILGFLNGASRRMAARVPQDIPAEKVTHWPLFAVEYYMRQQLAQSPGALTLVHLWAGREFSRRVIRNGLGNATGIYTFNSAGIELLEYARQRGLFCVMEQTIAPAVVEDLLLSEEENKHSGWEPPREANPYRAEFAARERAEWSCTDVILCGSEFVRQGIAEAGGPADQCVVVPYGVDPPPAVPPRTRQSRLHVLVAGSVSLRKGAPYVLEVARSLRREAEFRWCGSVRILPEAARRLSEYVELTGAVPRPRMAEHYAWADVLLLPSICEGSATVCYEALAAGLPVITTPNAGSVIRDGIEGFIVPIRDPQATVDRLERFARYPELLECMSEEALQRSREFSVEKYSERLIAALNVALQRQEGPCKGNL